MAVMLGAIVCVVLFVPFVAVSYRRRGSMSFGRAVVWVGAAVYALAIWTYTLLPLPQSDDYRCVGVNLNPLGFVDDINAAIATGHPLTSMLLLQLVFNVALFVPLGFFLRVLAGRGFFVTVAVGLGVSLLIEFTQLTGVWGLFPCAYRVFDVVDLMSNTLGALIGAVLAYVVPAHVRSTAVRPEAAQPRPVTRGRRLLAMVCDAAGFWLVSVTVSVGAALAYAVVTGAKELGDWPVAAGTISAVALWTIVTLATGQSIGDLAVLLRYTQPRVPQVLARVLRLAGGVVGWIAVGYVPLIGSQLSAAFVIAAFVLIFLTPDSRGMPGLISTQRLIDARETSGAAPDGSDSSRHASPRR